MESVELTRSIIDLLLDNDFDDCAFGMIGSSKSTISFSPIVGTHSWTYEMLHIVSSSSSSFGVSTFVVCLLMWNLL